MSSEADERYKKALRPLRAFCDAHGYRWRWKINRPDQWHATVQIIDPRQREHRDKVRAWYSSTNVDELDALSSAVRYAIGGAQHKLDVDDRSARNGESRS